MFLDHGTAVNLELLKSTACAGANQTTRSLYNVMNHTNTLTGGLTLRANLLEPPTGTCLFLSSAIICHVRNISHNIS